MDDNSDDELERAIAMSMESVVGTLDTTDHISLSQPVRPRRDVEGEPKAAVESVQGHSQRTISRKSQHTVINLVSDDEDDDLDAPVVIRNTSLRLSNVGENGGKRPPLNQLEARSTCSSAVDKDTSIVANSTHARSKEAETTIQNDQEHASGLSGMNRKLMEEERLARASLKRKREDESRAGLSELRDNIETDTAKVRDSSGEPNLTETGVSRFRYDQIAARPINNPNSLQLERRGDAVDTQITDLPSKSTTRRPPVSNGVVEIANNCPPASSSNAPQRNTMANGVQFPEGVVRKTWAYGYPRHGDDIKLEEVLQKSDLELAVLSSFQIDTEWIISKLSNKTRVIWVLQAKTEAEVRCDPVEFFNYYGHCRDGCGKMRFYIKLRQNWRQQAPSNYRFCFPEMSGNINCMHSKLQLLSHPTHLRVVVPSANLTAYDWGETGVMENTCFLIDLPRRSDNSKSKLEQLPAFGRDLLYFITALGLDQPTVDSLLRFDFSGTKGLAFIHTIGGSSVGDHWKRTGYCGLGAAVQSLGLQTKGTVSVDFVASSIGNLNDEFVRSMYLAAKGDDGLTEYHLRMNQSATTSLEKSETKTALWNQIKAGFRVYFPLQKTVEQSKGGTGAAGTICFQERWYNAMSFPRNLMRDCKSRRRGMLMHNKMMFVRHPGGTSGWAYIGSANFSESAWGRLVKDRTTKEPKLNCRNWECGVLIPVPSIVGSNARCQLEEDLTSFDLFNGHVPIPFDIPAEEYELNKPWFSST